MYNSSYSIITNEQSASDILVPVYMHTNYPIPFDLNQTNKTSLQTNNLVEWEQQEIIEPITNQQLTTEEKEHQSMYVKFVVSVTIIAFIIGTLIVVITNKK